MTGKVWVFGDNIDTDAIIPACYLNVSAAGELACHCFEGVSDRFAEEVIPGDVIVAGENFGCGSSREHAPLAIRGSGVACVIAKSFARIFYRNAINTGLPILECPDVVPETAEGDELRVDLEAGTIINLRTQRTYHTSPFPRFILSIVEAGGLIPYTISRLGGSNGCGVESDAHVGA